MLKVIITFCIILLFGVCLPLSGIAQDATQCPPVTSHDAKKLCSHAKSRLAQIEKYDLVKPYCSLKTGMTREEVAAFFRLPDSTDNVLLKNDEKKNIDCMSFGKSGIGLWFKDGKFYGWGK